MKSSYLIIKDKKLIIETYSGIVTLENAKQHKLEMSKDPDYSSEFEVISDLSKAILDIPPGAMPELTSQYFNGNTKSAALVHRANQPVYERIYNNLRSMFPEQHIYSVQLDGLLEWLGLRDYKDIVLNSLEAMHEKPQYNWA